MFQEVPNGFQSFHVDGRDGFTWPEWAGFPATPLGPEIVVLKRSGEPIASRRSGMFLGARVVGYERVRKLTIRNIGTKTLKGLSTRIIRNKQGDFTCTPVAKRSLEPGESMEIKIRFVPSTDGYRRAVLRIESNDSNENPVVIRLRGLGMK